MAKSSNDLFSTLRTYVSKLTEGERTPAEVAAAVNAWARESADALKAKINEEVESSVAKMGFIKRDEFDRLAAQVAAMNSGKSTAKKAPAKKTAAKKSTAKKSAKKVVKR